MTLEDFLLQKDEIGSEAALKHKVNSDPDFRNNLEAIYQEMFGKKLNKECPDCWCDAYMEILSEAMPPKRFQLRAGAVLTDDESGAVYNRHGISDKYALEYIKKHPESIELFAVVPQDIDTLTEAL